MATIEHMSASGTEYTLYRPDTDRGRSIVFYPGMACNRFGHPIHNQPRSAVADLVEIASDDYNIIFPEIHMPEALEEKDAIEGLTVEVQNQKVVKVLADTANKAELGNITYIGQSLGSLAIAQLVECQTLPNTQRAIFWGPPSLEGAEHKDMLISKFKHKEGTSIDETGKGQLQFGNGKLMFVSPEYWSSLDENSLRTHYDAMKNSYESLTAIFATEDDYYPYINQYLAEYTPTIYRIEVPGASHTFRQKGMREDLKKIMREILLGV